MKTSQLLSLELSEEVETEALVKERRGTGKEKEMRGATDSGIESTNLRFSSSEKSDFSGAGVYELLGMSSEWDPQYEFSGEGEEEEVALFSGDFGVEALGEM